MKIILTFILVFYSITSFGQQLTIKEWDKLAKNNKNLLPKYGQQPKTKKELKTDAEFLGNVLGKDSIPRDVSDHLIQLGFKYLYSGNLKTAMSRFNQAYLVDSTNTDIYWGYGAVYMELGDYPKAKQQYMEGISKNPTNPHLLADYGAYYLFQYQKLKPVDDNAAEANLDSAITYMTNSYLLDLKNQNTAYKLSLLHFFKNDCESALKYFKETKALGGQNINEAYSKALEEKCSSGK